MAFAAGPPPAHQLTAQILTNFHVGRKTNSPGCITSLDFTSRGDSMVYSTDEPDESLHLYNVSSAQPKKSVFCKKSGCEIVRFTHHTNCVIVASKNKGWDDSIRYLSLHDNKYLRYFKGHRDRFLSAGLDRTMRLWDLRTNVCQGLMNLPPAQQQGANNGKILVAHDPAGMVFALACSPNIIKLFDSRSYDSGPFLTFEIPHLGSSSPSSFSTWSSLKFSPDGKDLLVSTTERHEWSGSTPLTDAQNFTNQILLIDSYDGSPKQTYVGHEFNPNSANATGATSTATASSSSYASLPFEASFSPDGAFVFAGSRSGSVHSWHTATGEPAAIWNGLNTTAPITAVQFCPTKMALVAGDANGQVLWWIPNL